MNITVNDLSADQRTAYDSIVRWMGDTSAFNGSVLTLGGYAGSGKSTLVSFVAEQTDLPAFVAYTGKATSVLRRKLRAAGTETVERAVRRDTFDERRPFCGTIHSLIYRPCDCRELEAEDDKDKEEKPKDEPCKLCDDKGWVRREVLDRNYGLIIVDEASMVDDNMLQDLKSYGTPILAVGDHGQLPPVSGVGSLMKAPHLRLEKIHRQAEGNPIIALSKYIREEGRLPEHVSDSEYVRFGQMRFHERLIEERYVGASPARLLEMSLACYRNSTRVGLNATVRRVLGHKGKPPPAGEHVICLRNMKAEGGRQPVANGMRGVLTSDMREAKSKHHVTASIEFPEDGIKAANYTMLSKQFGREATFQNPNDLARETGGDVRSFSTAGSLFDFGYAMTVHKMQGSQFDDLVVCVERPGPVSDEDWRRWLYTAVTRAAKKLTVLR